MQTTWPMVTVRMTWAEREALKQEARAEGISLQVHARRLFGLPDKPRSAFEPDASRIEPIGAETAAQNRF